MIREAVTPADVPQELALFIDDFVSNVAEYWMDTLDNDEQYQNAVAGLETKLRAELYTLIARSNAKIDALR